MYIPISTGYWRFSLISTIFILQLSNLPKCNALPRVKPKAIRALEAVIDSNVNATTGSLVSTETSLLTGPTSTVKPEDGPLIVSVEATGSPNVNSSLLTENVTTPSTSVANESSAKIDNITGLPVEGAKIVNTTEPPTNPNVTDAPLIIVEGAPKIIDGLSGTIDEPLSKDSIQGFQSISALAQVLPEEATAEPLGAPKVIVIDTTNIPNVGGSVSNVNTPIVASPVANETIFPISNADLTAEIVGHGAPLQVSEVNITSSATSIEVPKVVEVNETASVNETTSVIIGAPQIIENVAGDISNNSSSLPTTPLASTIINANETTSVITIIGAPQIIENVPGNMATNESSLTTVDVPIISSAITINSSAVPVSGAPLVLTVSGVNASAPTSNNLTSDTSSEPTLGQAFGPLVIPASTVTNLTENLTLQNTTNVSSAVVIDGAPKIVSDIPGTGLNFTLQDDAQLQSLGQLTTAQAEFRLRGNLSSPEGNELGDGNIPTGAPLVIGAVPSDSDSKAVQVLPRVEQASNSSINAVIESIPGSNASIAPIEPQATIITAPSAPLP